MRARPVALDVKWVSMDEMRQVKGDGAQPLVLVGLFELLDGTKRS